jgi:nucleoside-diphosphate-sugar epimerase
MRILFVGGTGNISASASRLLLLQGHELWLLHRTSIRGQKEFWGLESAHEILCDIHNEAQVLRALGSMVFDAVVNWIAFVPAQVEQDLRIFAKRTAQYVFISSASAYLKPPRTTVITEATPLGNPYWSYSRDKIDCETVVRKAMQEGIPATIVRPSLTYDTVLPVPFGGWNEWSIVAHMQKGNPVVAPGDGAFPWTITHSEDFARGFAPLLGHPGALGEDFHITSDEHPTWTQIYEWLGEAIGCKPVVLPRPVGEILRVEPQFEGTLLGDKAWPTIFDNSKIRTIAPDFKAILPFREGIKRTVQWFETEKTRMRVLPGTMEMLERLSGIPQD